LPRPADYPSVQYGTQHSTPSQASVTTHVATHRTRIPRARTSKHRHKHVDKHALSTERNRRNSILILTSKLDAPRPRSRGAGGSGCDSTPDSRVRLIRAIGR
jgi:hypothetical protein